MWPRSGLSIDQRPVGQSLADRTAHEQLDHRGARPVAVVKGGYSLKAWPIAHFSSVAVAVFRSPMAVDAIILPLQQGSHLLSAVHVNGTTHMLAATVIDCFVPEPSLVKSSTPAHLVRVDTTALGKHRLDSWRIFSCTMSEIGMATVCPPRCTRPMTACLRQRPHDHASFACSCACYFPCLLRTSHRPLPRHREQRRHHTLMPCGYGDPYQPWSRQSPA